MSGRKILDLISEYVSMKDNVDLHPDLISPEQAEEQLNEIATAFEVALRRL